ncbi:virB8 family protein [Sandaracinobacteroides saxicola]|uniref:Type IV secretion system protein n=1 Tax=Sandaracinobacteroides saxicola TaxID=2759707 RepID=A0A7G5IGG9_9SPHN|nr:type IV secretion system protein [Sandaracinobacteroides saxicola]QMW22461.1 type IV secretion system protein [Sandaracinobacteroides saxicola]
MLPEARDAVQSNFQAAASWKNDGFESALRSQRFAWLIALIASGIALILGIAVVIMLPLKTVVPYTLLVDRHTGYVQALDPTDNPRIAPDAALTRSFLAQYVTAREGFDRATVKQDYRRVMLWSNGRVRTVYSAALQASNPNSPLVALPRGSTIESRVRSISSLDETTALVRFETIRRDQNGAVQLPRYWVAIVRYNFSNGPMTVEDRFINPLGFQVTSYRRNAETPSQSAADGERQSTPGANANTGVVAPSSSSTTPLPPPVSNTVQR